VDLSNKKLLSIGKKVHSCLCDLNDNRNETAHYGAGWERSKPHLYCNTACHMGLMFHPGTRSTGPVVISNQVQINRKRSSWVGEEVLDKYYGYLFNESPFKDCYVTKDPSVVFDDGITVRTDLPANLVVAACIATRQAWEYKEVAQTFVRLVGLGVSPRKAHLAAHLIRVSVDSSSYVDNKRYSHIAVYASAMGKGAVQNFLKGELPNIGGSRYNTDTYQQVKSYRGIPNMWGGEGNGLEIEEGTEIRVINDPFGFIKQIGEIKPAPKPEDKVNKAFERIGL
jgi:hypothetical protein